MSYLEKIETYLARQQEGNDQAQGSEVIFEDIPLMTLSELARRNMAIEVYSEILDCKIWLCSDDDMASQIKKDDPETICYTVNELKELIKLNPDVGGLRGIHNAKSVFPGSGIVDSKLKEEF